MLILVRHSLPRIVPQAPARLWTLSAAGRRRCGPLARRIAAHRPGLVFTSQEPKAEATGRLIAEQMGIPWRSVPDLHEHDRSGVDFFQDRSVFIQQVRKFFAHPATLVFGRETATQAHQRFAVVVQKLVAQHPQETLVIVSHGTVMSLFVSLAGGLDPFPFWQSLGMPAYVVLRPLGPERFEILAQESWEKSWEAETG